MEEIQIHGGKDSLKDSKLVRGKEKRNLALINLVMRKRRSGYMITQENIPLLPAQLHQEEVNLLCCTQENSAAVICPNWICIFI